jgi:hypothetical protein
MGMMDLDIVKYGGGAQILNKELYKKKERRGIERKIKLKMRTISSSSINSGHCS